MTTILTDAEAKALSELECGETLFDAMCMWEAVIDVETAAWAKVKSKPGFKRYDSSTYDETDLTPLEKAVSDWHGNVGSCEMRTTVAEWIFYLQSAWQLAHHVYDFEDCFDYEFCPWFLKHCIDHSSMTVRKDWVLQVRRIQDLQLSDLMAEAGWRVSPLGYLVVSDNEKFSSSFSLYRHVLKKAIKYQNPHYIAAIQKVNAETRDVLRPMAYGMYEKDLDEVIQ